MSQPSASSADNLSEAHVRRVARLARLELTDDQVRDSQGRLSAVLGFMQTLARVDVSETDEMTTPLELRNVLREDVPSAALQAGSDAQSRLLDLAPQRIGPYVGVPKTLEQGGAQGGEA